MPITIDRIFGDVQNEINDLSQEKIQRGEYLDFANKVAIDIAQDTEIYIARYISIPNPSTAPVTPAPFKVNLPFTDSLGNVLAPYRFLRVVRSSIDTDNTVKWLEAREWSVQTVARTSAGDNSFPQNQYQLDQRAFSSEFIDPTNLVVDGSLTLIFPAAFELDETLVIDFIQSVPFTITQWITPVAQSIPEWLVNSFSSGLLWRVLRRLYNRGDDSMQSRMINAKQEYEIELRKAMGYAHNLKDKNSTPQSFPVRWLSE